MALNSSGVGIELNPHAKTFVPGGKPPIVGTLATLGASPQGTRRLWEGPVTLIGGPLKLQGAVGHISGFAGYMAWFKPDAASRPGMGEVPITLETLASIPPHD
jgi:hypothetical protein